MTRTMADHSRAYRQRKAERIARMEAALRFYADFSSYKCGPGDVIITDYPVMDDNGDLAREALAPTPKP